MKFNYQARTKDGIIQTGIVEASDRDAAVEVLKSHDLFVTAMEQETIPIYAKRLKILEFISKKDIVIFSRQMAVMFKSRIPLVETFETLAKQTKNNSFREKILKISEKIEGGMPLSDSLSIFPKLFSPFYINMVRSGEASGKLTDVFLYLADYLEKDQYFREKVRGAMIYPAFIIAVFAIVIGIVVTFVIPQLAAFLLENDQQLPLITQIVINISYFLKNRGWILIVGLIIIGIILFRISKTPQGRKFFGSIILEVPLFGTYFKKIYLSRFAMNLSTLIAGGIPIAQALEITAAVVENNAYKTLISKTKDEVKKGEKISAVLAKYPDLVFPLFYQMVVVGEKTGTLDSSLNNVVEFYQNDVDRATDNFLKFLEPILIIFLAVLVAGFAIAVLMPLYSFGGI